MTPQGRRPPLRDPSGDRLRSIDRRLESLETFNPQPVFFNRTSVAATPYAVTADDHFIEVDTSALAITIDLQAAATAGAGRTIIVKDVSGNASGFTITIDGSGAETIDGLATATITTDYGVVRIITDGANWFTW